MKADALKGIKTVVFDLDGTLLDSTGLWAKVDADFFTKRGMKVPESYHTEIAGMGFAACASYTVSKWFPGESPQKVAEEWKTAAKEAYETSVGLKDGAGGYLRLLKEKNIRLGVATALSRDFLTPALKRLGIFDLVDAILSTDDLPGLGKEDGRLYAMAAEALGLPPSSCVAFEDSLVGITAAKAAGVRCFAIADPGADRDREKILRIADGFFASFSEAPFPFLHDT